MSCMGAFVTVCPSGGGTLKRRCCANQWKPNAVGSTARMGVCDCSLGAKAGKGFFFNFFFDCLQCNARTITELHILFWE